MYPCSLVYLACQLRQDETTVVIGTVVASYIDMLDRLTMSSSLPPLPFFFSMLYHITDRDITNRDTTNTGPPGRLCLCGVRQEFPAAQPTQGPPSGTHRYHSRVPCDWPVPSVCVCGGRNGLGYFLVSFWCHDQCYDQNNSESRKFIWHTLPCHDPSLRVVRTRTQGRHHAGVPLAGLLSGSLTHRLMLG